MMKRLSRRRLLQGLGASLFAIPVLGRTRTARAAGGVAKRLVVFFSPNGTIPHRWRPSGSGAAFDFPAGSILEPLAAIKSKLLLIDGLDFKETSNHEGGMRHMLTGGEGGETNGMSLDMYVASQIGTGRRFPALTLGVQTSAWGGSVQTRMSYRGPGDMVAPDDDPAHVHRSLFGEAGAPGEVDRLLAKRRSVIDLLKEELDDLGRLAGEKQRRKVDLHLEAIRQMENSLTGSASGTAGDCTSPGGVFAMNAQDNDNFPAVGRAQMDLLVAGLACGFSDVGTIQWSHTVSPTVPTWLNLSEGHHALSHMSDGNAQGVADFVTAERWFAEQFRYLVERLDALPEPDGAGSMLDNTVVLWAKEMGDSRLHVCESVPFVIAGGGFTTGRYLTYPGESHTKLLVSICRAMGLSNATFGDPSHGTGELAGLRG